MNTIQTEIINDIRGAKTSIKVAVSWFTDPLIIDELIKKAYEKKNVKVIVSGEGSTQQAFGSMAGDVVN